MPPGPPPLTGRELAEIADLERRVVAHDGGRLKLEWSVLGSRPEVQPLLRRTDDGRLVGFLGIYAFGREPELAGMVDPDARRRGVGTGLLREALGLVTGRGHATALLVVPRSTPAGGAFALAHGGIHHHSEHYLVLGATPPEDAVDPAVRVRDAGAADVPAIRSVLAAAFGEEPVEVPFGDPAERQLVVEQAGHVVGALRVTSHAGTAGIYGFAVHPVLQGRGVGRSVLRQVCRAARRDGHEQVTLEVAVGNDRALGLYTSVGFEPRATEDYYALRPPR